MVIYLLIALYLLFNKYVYVNIYNVEEKSHFSDIGLLLLLLSRVQLFVTMGVAACQAPLLHCLPEFAQIHVPWVSDTI